MHQKKIQLCCVWIIGTKQRTIQDQPLRHLVLSRNCSQRLTQEALGVAETRQEGETEETLGTFTFYSLKYKTILMKPKWRWFKTQIMASFSVKEKWFFFFFNKQTSRDTTVLSFFTALDLQCLFNSVAANMSSSLSEHFHTHTGITTWSTWSAKIRCCTKCLVEAKLHL